MRSQCSPILNREHVNRNRYISDTKNTAMLQEVKLGEEFKSYHCTSKYDRENIIDSLSRINIFIGSNNSGKSRLLRTLFSNNTYLFKNNSISEEEYKSAISSLLYEVYNDLNMRYHIPINISDEIRSIITIKLRNLILLNVNNGTTEQSINRCDSEMSEKNLHQALDKYETRHNLPNRIYNQYNSNHEISKFKEKLKSDHQYNFIFSRHYIPILRSLKGLSPREEIGINSFTDIYKSKTIEEYFEDNQNKPNLNIFTGLTLYEDVTKLLLGNTADRNKVRKFEQFLQDSFFEQEVNIVPHLASKTLHVKIGNKEHPIHELGDGIQAIIILTYPLFMHEGENAIFFIEEPETHLHPGYQRLFIETLLHADFKNYQYFFTTHSNHFLDITLDYDNISVYTLNRHSEEDEFDVENVTSVDDNVLKLIGARTSSVFLSNCTIWVEGITDRIYIRKYLEIIQKDKPIKYKEDYHYSFVEYAGNNITHWSFLDSEDDDHPNINVEKLCAKLFLITDNDGAGLKLNGEPNTKKLKKHERHKKLKHKLKDRYYLLACREIENLLTKKTVEQVIRDYEPENKELDFTKFHKQDHEDKQLGKLIEDKVNGIKKKYTYKSDAINDKVKFAKTAFEHINTYEDLSVEAREIAEKLYEFIKENNS